MKLHSLNDVLRVSWAVLLDSCSPMDGYLTTTANSPPRVLRSWHCPAQHCVYLFDCGKIPAISMRESLPHSLTRLSHRGSASLSSPNRLAECTEFNSENAQSKLLFFHMNVRAWPLWWTDVSSRVCTHHASSVLRIGFGSTTTLPRIKWTLKKEEEKQETLWLVGTTVVLWQKVPASWKFAQINVQAKGPRGRWRSWCSVELLGTSKHHRFTLALFFFARSSVKKKAGYWM